MIREQHRCSGQAVPERPPLEVCWVEMFAWLEVVKGRSDDVREEKRRRLDLHCEGPSSLRLKPESMSAGNVFALPQMSINLAIFSCRGVRNWPNGLECKGFEMRGTRSHDASASAGATASYGGGNGHPRLRLTFWPSGTLTMASFIKPGRTSVIL